MGVSISETSKGRLVKMNTQYVRTVSAQSTWNMQFVYYEAFGGLSSQESPRSLGVKVHSCIKLRMLHITTFLHALMAQRFLSLFSVQCMTFLLFSIFPFLGSL